MRISLSKTIFSISPSNLATHLTSSNVYPLKLTGLISHWPALSWSADNGLQELREAVGEGTMVEVELSRKGRGYLDPEWQRVTMGFGLFLDAFVLGRIPSSSSSTVPLGYLAQSDLIASHPTLASAVPTLPHFTSGPQSTMYRRTLWVGPARTFTPFHRDPYIGLFSQVVGKKTFYCLPPEAEQFLNVSRHPLHNNTSEIPLPISHILKAEDSEASIQQYRNLLTQAFDLPGACEVRLEPGDSILVPQRWWHSAEGLDEPVSIGVGAWFR